METIYENVSVVEFRTKLAVRKLEENLYAFRRTHTTTEKSSEGKLPLKKPVPAPVANRGFVDDKNRKLMIAGKPFKTKDFHILTPEVREMLRTMGWSRAMDAIGKDKALMNAFARDADPFDAFDAGATLDDLVRVDTGGHMLFDRNDKALPVGVYFDYMSGHVDNSHYDIPKLAELLLKNPNVRVYAKQGRRLTREEPDYERLAQSVEEAVMSVPYYNNDSGCRETVYFHWVPTAEEYTVMWEWCVAQKKSYPSTAMHQAIFTLDLLGVRSAAKVDTYYG